MRTSHPQHGYFSLTGQFDPEDITTRLQIKPSWSAKAGDTNPDSKLTRKASLWCAACSEQKDVKDQISDLLRILRPCADEASSLCATFSGTMNLVASLDQNNGNFYLSAGTVIELASYNVSIDCRYFQANNEISLEPADAN